MTKEEVKNFVTYVANPPSVISQILSWLDDPFEMIVKWAPTAQIEWLDSFIELINHPNRDDPAITLEEWNEAIAQIVGWWVGYAPDDIVPRVGGLIDQSDYRPTIIRILGNASTPLVFPYVAPWVHRVNELSDDEAAYLIDAIGESKVEERHDALKEIQKLIDPTKKEAMIQLAHYGFTNE